MMSLQEAAACAGEAMQERLEKPAQTCVLGMRLKGQDHDYEIHIGPQALQQLQRLLKGRRCAIVTDNVVWGLHGETLCEALGLSTSALAEIENGWTAGRETFYLTPAQREGDIQLLSVSVVPNGEANKNMAQLTRLYQDFVKGGVTRRDVIIAFGGGVIGDLAGYAAATWLRGVEFIQVPTSLLAMVDSSVGGKVAIDLPEGKNLVGAFHQPKAVLVDPSFLDTLPARRLRDGLAEMVKASMIRDADLLPLILEQFVTQAEVPVSRRPKINRLITRAIEIKKKVVEMDEKEVGDRKLLNFGHTLGHAAESRVGYNPELMTHGEGVAFGMQWITRLSEEKGLSEAGTAGLLASALTELGFEAAPPLDFPALKDWVLRDKKMTDTGLEVILIRQPGEGYVHRLAAGEVDAFFNTSSTITDL